LKCLLFPSDPTDKEKAWLALGAVIGYWLH
jgi:hypothetical protein